jgi:hypothetical protein
MLPPPSRWAAYHDDSIIGTPDRFVITPRKHMGQNTTNSSLDRQNPLSVASTISAIPLTCFVTAVAPKRRTNFAPVMQRVCRVALLTAFSQHNSLRIID